MQAWPPPPPCVAGTGGLHPFPFPLRSRCPCGLSWLPLRRACPPRASSPSLVALVALVAPPLAPQAFWAPSFVTWTPKTTTSCAWTARWDS